MNRYIQYAKVLKMIVVDKGNFKTVLFREFKEDSKLKEAYGILIKATKNYEKIAEIGEQLNKKLKRDAIGNVQLFCVLVVEQFYSIKKKIVGGGQLKKIIVENSDFIAKQLNIDLNADNSGLIKQDVHIRWIARPSAKADSSEQQQKKKKKDKSQKNSTAIEIEEAEQQDSFVSKAIKDTHGFLRRATADEHIKGLYQIGYADYQQAIKEDGTIMDSSEFVIQSKSSAMPAYLLFKNVINLENKPDDKFDMIDCCSAPGNKTMQSGEYIAGRGSVHAFEKNHARFEILRDRVGKYGFGDIITCHNEDFLAVDTDLYKNVKYIVADPSCSGTGMLNHIYFDEDQIQLEKDNKNSKLSFQDRSKALFAGSDKKMQQRIQSLSEFQLKILNKLATFPNIKAFSYSTCSIHQQENEDVVANFLKVNPNFELVHACPEWKTRGFTIPELKDAHKCIRVNPFENKSDGFFVALLRKKDGSK